MAPRHLHMSALSSQLSALSSLLSALCSLLSIPRAFSFVIDVGRAEEPARGGVDIDLTMKICGRLDESGAGLQNCRTKVMRLLIFIISRMACRTRFRARVSLVPLLMSRSPGPGGSLLAAFRNQEPTNQNRGSPR